MLHATPLLAGSGAPLARGRGAGGSGRHRNARRDCPAARGNAAECAGGGGRWRPLLITSIFAAGRQRTPTPPDRRARSFFLRLCSRLPWPGATARAWLGDGGAAKDRPEGAHTGRGPRGIGTPGGQRIEAPSPRRGQGAGCPRKRGASSEQGAARFVELRRRVGRGS